jgi:hypothetical protein
VTVELERWVCALLMSSKVGKDGRTLAVLIALAIIGILIAAVVLLSGRSPTPFQVDDLYGLLD